MGRSRRHWEDIYTATGETAVSWYQPHAARSLQLIESASPDRRASVIDIGGGASTLVDDLLAGGFTDIAVLDIAEPALARAKARLGERADRVDWITADITRWKPGRRWDIWHDRAVFHFLTSAQERQRYRLHLLETLNRGGSAIVATFSLDGPDKCSGLPVQRYSADTLSAELGPELAMIEALPHVHTTPWGSRQPFVYCRFRRVN